MNITYMFVVWSKSNVSLNFEICHRSRLLFKVPNAKIPTSKTRMVNIPNSQNLAWEKSRIGNPDFGRCCRCPDSFISIHSGQLWTKMKTPLAATATPVTVEIHSFFCKCKKKHESQPAIPPKSEIRNYSTVQH